MFIGAVQYITNRFYDLPHLEYKDYFHGGVESINYLDNLSLQQMSSNFELNQNQF